ncbi:MAG: hypothetical protein K6C32_03310 [Bacilli bacterium]|nr:hypothetical protein [Bacilli bacterium]
MKKTFALLFALTTVVPSMVGCTSNSKMKLTYGRYLPEDYSGNGALFIDYADLSMRMSKDGKYLNENFLLTIAPTNGCGCWAEFQPILKSFVQKTNYNVYQIKITAFDEAETKFGLNMKQGHVAFAIINHGKIVKQYLSSPIFDYEESLEKEVNKYVTKPDLYFVDYTDINNYISSKGETVVEYIWNSCSDCQYSNPQTLWPYVEKHTLKNKIYVVDLESIRTDSEVYKQYLLDHKLSLEGDENYGYDRGFVPTIQHFTNGVLDDASVYFNDALSMVDGKVKVTRSFYSEVRKEKLHYLNGVEVTVLEGLEVKEDEYVEYNGNYYWNKANANVYHKPLLEAFLNTYVL